MTVRCLPPPLLFLLSAPALACAEGGGLDADRDLPSPYAEDREMDDDTPRADPDVIVGAALAGLDAFITLEPDAIVTAYEQLAVADATCPEEYSVYSEDGVEATVWSTPGCTTAAGVTFRGTAQLERVTTTTGGATIEGAALSSDDGAFRVTAPGGEFLQFSGYVYYERSSDAEVKDSYFEFHAIAQADPQTAAVSPALADGVTISGNLYSYTGPGYQGMGGSGYFAGPSLGAARAVQFSDFDVNADECAEEPIGTLSMRDAEGFWYDLVFDSATSCDGCGALLAGGEAAGRACVDAGRVSGLLDWQDYPW